ncbi:type II CRISPR RNA-guided endonuclease Cas9 [Enterococcus rivorum]|uniref:type II CRISPR RNA-guided endonuclease Cas9 n=1 Tax=Enterococcus rivorum TaxID=762845 RepID=UPI00362CBC5B
MNRQLVETRQITKNVAIILDKIYNDEAKNEKEVAIITLKSALTSQYRQGIIYVPNDDFDELKLVSKTNSRLKEVKLHDGFYKVREINDYHHAHDAYLNNVVATYLYEAMPDLRPLFVYGEHSREIHKRFLGKYATTRKGQFKQLLVDMQDEYWMRKDKEGNFIDGEILWRRDEVLQIVKKVLDYRNIQITKKLEMMVTGGEEKSFYQDSRCRKDKTAIPYKTNWDPSKYGGFKSPRTAYAIPVIKKNKPKLEPVLLVNRSKVETDGQFDCEKFKELNPTLKILGQPIWKYQSFEMFDGTKRYIASASEIHKGNQIKFSQEHMKFISCCQKYDEVKNKLAFDFVNESKHLFQEILTAIKDNIHRYRLIAEGIEVHRKFSNMLENIEKLSTQELVDNLLDAINITSVGTTNNAFGRVRYKGSYLNEIWSATLIHQSVTGLYETREKLI